MAKIKERGRLIAGVSADTYLLGSRNPLNGKIEGFDIDMVKAVAKAIFGDENTYQLKVITAAQRIPALQNGDVDIVARNMTINCDRWKQIAFSTEYYRSGQKILVRKGSKANSLADLNGQRVCAPKGTSSMDNLIKLAPEGDPGRVRTATPAAWCCSSRARSTRSPATTPCWPDWPRRTRTRWCPDQKAFTAEPYGLGFNSADVDFVRFVNARLAADAQRRRVDRDLQPLAGRLARPGPQPAQGRLRQEPVTVAGPRPVQASAPAAPGRHGCRRSRPRPPRSISTQLGQWRDDRRRELDELDRAALAAPNGATATSDILLSMALWKAVSDRYELLLATWDSGRVGSDRAAADGRA